MDSVLDTENKDIMVIKRASFGLFKSFFVLIFLIGFLYFCINIIMQNYLVNIVGTNLIVINITVAVFSFFYLVMLLLSWSMTDYVVAPGVINQSIGVLKKRKVSLRVDNNHSLSVSQSIFQKLLNAGTLTYHDSEKNVTVEIADVIDPFKIKELILKDLPKGVGEFVKNEAPIFTDSPVPDQPKHAKYVPPVEEYHLVAEGVSEEIVVDSATSASEQIENVEILEEEVTLEDSNLIVATRTLKITLENSYNGNLEVTSSEDSSEGEFALNTEEDSKVNL